MRFFRQFISDATCGSPLAALIGVLLALLALIGGFGTGAMAFASVETGIICSAGTAEVDHHEAAGGTHKPDSSTHKMDCCLTACQIAAAAHAGIPAKPPLPVAFSATEQSAGFIVADIDVSPGRLGLSRTARGPPGYPI